MQSEQEKGEWGWPEEQTQAQMEVSLLLFIKCVSSIFKKHFALAYHFSPRDLKWGRLLIKHYIIFL